MIRGSKHPHIPPGNKEPRPIAQILKLTEPIAAYYLLPKLFRILANRIPLGEFWRSLVIRYREDVCRLDDGKIRYIIKARERGETASNIAGSLLISKTRVEQLYAEYRRTGDPPILRRV